MHYNKHCCGKLDKWLLMMSNAEVLAKLVTHRARRLKAKI